MEFLDQLSILFLLVQSLYFYVFVPFTAYLMLISVIREIKKPTGGKQKAGDK